MKDMFSRSIRYMRISITDRCNLNCLYCRPAEIPFIPHDAILRYEEILRICNIVVDMGVTVLRVTGGEPLMRKDCLPFLKALKQIPGLEHVTLTTNGVCLQDHLQGLSDMGLDGLNISLDTLSPERYRKITGADGFERVWAAIRQGIQLGIPIKLNFVPIQGVNEDEIIPMANLTRTLPIGVRFIELMPSSENKGLQRIPTDTILTMLQAEFDDLKEDPARRGFGPARIFQSAQIKGSLGLISALSDSFCTTCNRLRLTSEGFLKLCLHHNLGIDLRALLRDGADDAAIARAIADGVRKKPEQHDLQKGTRLNTMSQIGG